LYIDTNGESCDGGSDYDDDEETATTANSSSNNNSQLLSVENFVFIGANIKTGKSSLRSKPAAKKVRRFFFFKGTVSRGSARFFLYHKGFKRDCYRRNYVGNKGYFYMGSCK
jgi:hypothetical protein